MTKRKGGLGRSAIYLAMLVLAGVVVFATASYWMTAMGQFLIRAEAPAPADIAVVLAGDSYGERLTTAISLVEAKQVPAVLVDGPIGPYGTWESDLAIDWAVKQGKPREWFIPNRMDADSTMEEARLGIAWLRAHNMKRIAIVTSNFHTRRSGNIFRSLAPDLEFHVIESPCRDFSPGTWWKSRRSQKYFAMEWQKTIAFWLGL